jgi:hypothetical protein
MRSPLFNFRNSSSLKGEELGMAKQTLGRQKRGAVGRRLEVKAVDLSANAGPLCDQNGNELNVNRDA